MAAEVCEVRGLLVKLSTELRTLLAEPVLSVPPKRRPPLLADALGAPAEAAAAVDGGTMMRSAAMAAPGLAHAAPLRVPVNSSADGSLLTVCRAPNPHHQSLRQKQLMQTESQAKQSQAEHTEARIRISREL